MVKKSTEISFRELLDAFLDAERPFPAAYIYRLSDLEEPDLSRLGAIWNQAPAWRRQALVEDALALAERNYVLSFENLARLTLQDEVPGVRTAAVHILREFQEPGLIVNLLEMLTNDPDEGVRAAAATALGDYLLLGELEKLERSLHLKVEEHLLDAFRQQESALVRRRVLESLGYSDRQDVKRLILEAYLSNDKDWLAAALFAMGRSANQIWREQVLEMLAHQAAAVRTEAARAAGELAIEAAVDRLIELLEDPDEDVVSAAIWALSEIGGQGVRERLEALYENAHDDQEIEFLEAALDNLEFNEGLGELAFLDIPEDQDIEVYDEDPFDFDAGDEEPEV